MRENVHTERYIITNYYITKLLMNNHGKTSVIVTELRSAVQRRTRFI